MRLFLLSMMITCMISCEKEENTSVEIKPNNSCSDRAVFGNPEDSEYVLPYPVGNSYYVSQSYCYIWGGHNDQLAYDFATVVGDTICAARAGIVMQVREDLEDTGDQTDRTVHNHIFILHADSTVAFYAHLKKNSVIPIVSDTITQGEVIALSGNSGNTGNFPHLHFGVYQEWLSGEGFDVPVNFKNAEGMFDSRNGLKLGEYYKALPY